MNWPDEYLSPLKNLVFIKLYCSLCAVVLVSLKMPRICDTDKVPIKIILHVKRPFFGNTYYHKIELPDVSDAVLNAAYVHFVWTKWFTKKLSKVFLTLDKRLGLGNTHLAF